MFFFSRDNFKHVHCIFHLIYKKKGSSIISIKSRIISNHEVSYMPLYCCNWFLLVKFSFVCDSTYHNPSNIHHIHPEREIPNDLNCFFLLDSTSKLGPGLSTTMCDLIVSSSPSPQNTLICKVYNFLGDTFIHFFGTRCTDHQYLRMLFRCL